MSKVLWSRQISDRVKGLSENTVRSAHRWWLQRRAAQQGQLLRSLRKPHEIDDGNIEIAFRPSQFNTNTGGQRQSRRAGGRAGPVNYAEGRRRPSYRDMTEGEMTKQQARPHIAPVLAL